MKIYGNLRKTIQSENSLRIIYASLTRKIETTAKPTALHRIEKQHEISKNGILSQIFELDSWAGILD